jgi:hypothetical protein
MCWLGWKGKFLRCVRIGGAQAPRPKLGGSGEPLPRRQRSYVEEMVRRSYSLWGRQLVAVVEHGESASSHGMQPEPIVKSSPVHYRRRNRPNQSNLSSFNRFRAAVANVALHHFHQPVQPTDKSGEPAELPMSGHQQQQHQMGRLRKFAGASLLSRFRSGSKTTSEDEENPAARAAVTKVVGGVQETSQPCNVSDPIPGCIVPTSDDVPPSHTWPSVGGEKVKAILFPFHSRRWS